MIAALVVLLIVTLILGLCWKASESIVVFTLEFIFRTLLNGCSVK